MGRTVRVRLEDLPPISEERLREIEAIPDEEIDVSDIPEWTEEEIANATWHPGHGKKQVTIRLDRDILDFFRKGGRGYQTRMNAVLRAYVDAMKKKAATDGG